MAADHDRIDVALFSVSDDFASGIADSDCRRHRSVMFSGHVRSVVKQFRRPVMGPLSKFLSAD